MTPSRHGGLPTESLSDLLHLPSLPCFYYSKTYFSVLTNIKLPIYNNFSSSPHRNKTEPIVQITFKCVLPENRESIQLIAARPGSKICAGPQLRMGHKPLTDLCYKRKRNIYNPRWRNWRVIGNQSGGSQRLYLCPLTF